MKKFELTSEFITNVFGVKLFRIRDRYKMQKIKAALAAAGAGSDAWGEKHGAAGGLDG